MSPRKIVCFMCNWVLPTEEEPILRGLDRTPFEISCSRIPCVGRLDPVMILEIFKRGACGVLMVGCAPPDCHFVDGNQHAEQSVRLLKKLLALAGLKSDRLRLQLFSPLEEVGLLDVIRGFADQLQKLDPQPLSGKGLNEEAVLNICAAQNVAADFRFRLLSGRERDLVETLNVYGEKTSKQEMDALIDEAVEAGFLQQKIRLLTTRKPMSVKELAALLKMKPALVLRYTVDMRRKGMITLDHVEDRTPIYRALEALQ